jgi:hypothetical protein
MGLDLETLTSSSSRRCGVTGRVFSSRRKPEGRSHVATKTSHPSGPSMASGTSTEGSFYVNTCFKLPISQKVPITNIMEKKNLKNSIE